MQASEIATLLGLPSTDPRVVEQLRRFGIDDGLASEPQDWLGNYGAGIEFGFEEEAAFMGLDASDRGASPMILTEIYFYGDHPAVHPYRWPLPLGLALEDNRQVVREKLAALEPTRRSYVRDTWETDALRMTISYADNGARIGFIVCMLRYEASLPFEQGATRIPTTETVISLLGKRPGDAALREVFVPLGLDRQAHGSSETLADFRTTYGFELRFSKPAPQAAGLVFSQILCYRDREMDARGWRGNLPLGITFDDSPEALERKVGRAPDDRMDEEFTGFAVWHFPAYSLCVYYSTMENMVLRVRILAPGEWAQYETD